VRSERFELGHDVFELPLVEPQSTPVLLVPPLMVRPYVYDLRPDHSLLRTLRNAGFAVYFVDFGVPDERDQQVRLDDYVLDYLPRCVEGVLDRSGAAELNMAGYCMGGIFCLLHVGTFRDDRVRSIVTIGAPVDFAKMGILYLGARLGVLGLDLALDLIGNVPGGLSSLGFKLMSGARLVTKYADLAAHLYDESYVRSFDAVNTWVNDLIPYPKEAFKQMVKEVISGNRLVSGKLSFDGRRCDLASITCPLLAFAGESDNIARAEATRRIVDVVGSPDKTFRLAPGGHIGVVAGQHAPERVWLPMSRWLSDRSG